MRDRYSGLESADFNTGIDSPIFDREFCNVLSDRTLHEADLIMQGILSSEERAIALKGLYDDDEEAKDEQTSV
jgi:hypothetical protein